MASSPVLELERLLLLEHRRPAPPDTCEWWRSEPDTELRHTELDTDSWLPRSEAAPQPGPRMEEVRCGTGAGGPCAEATELEESVERRREKVERAGGGGMQLQLFGPETLTVCYFAALLVARMSMYLIRET